MLVGTDERCARCGTLMRGGRAICPSCGLDQTSLEAHPSQVEIPMPVVESKCGVDQEIDLPGVHEFGARRHHDRV